MGLTDVRSIDNLRDSSNIQLHVSFSRVGQVDGGATILLLCVIKINEYNYYRNFPPVEIQKIVIVRWTLLNNS